MPRTHGKSRTPEWVAWRNMLRRCSDPTHPNYDKYGGRGITVCERWRDSFENFLADVGERPSPKHTLDRIDNDGDYTPENCRWATWTEQNRNTSRIVYVTYEGERLPASVWDERMGLPRGKVAGRIGAGWSPEAAVTTPVVPRAERWRWRGRK